MTLENSIDFPDIESCPECGHDRLWVTMLSLESGSVYLDGEGSVAVHSPTTDLIDAGYVSAGCHQCGTDLLQDGEIVHPELTEDQ